MKKEDILELSRQENKNKDVVAIETTNLASRIASITGMLLCIIISVLEWNLTKTINWACWVIDFAMLSVLNTMTFIKLKQQKTLILSVICILFFVFFSCGYIFELVSIV